MGSCWMGDHIKSSKASSWMGDHIKSSKASSWMGDEINRRIPLKLFVHMLIHSAELNACSYFLKCATYVLHTALDFPRALGKGLSITSVVLFFLLHFSQFASFFYNLLSDVNQTWSESSVAKGLP